VKRYIDSVLMLCIEIKTNSRASSEWAQCIAQARKYKMELESNRNLHPLGLEIARGDQNVTTGITTNLQKLTL